MNGSFGARVWDAIRCRFREDIQEESRRSGEKTGGFRSDLVHYRALVLFRDSFGETTDLRPTARQDSVLSRSWRELSPLRQQLQYPISKFPEHFRHHFFCDILYQR